MNAPSSTAPLPAPDLAARPVSVTDPADPAGPGHAESGSMAPAEVKLKVERTVGLMGGADFEASRAARRELAALVHQTGRPGAEAERRACSEALVAALEQERPEQVRRELLGLIAEISGDEAVSVVAALLLNEALRDDARMALERIPGKRSLKALESALGKVPTDFRRALAVSMRARGMSLQGLPSQKLIPTRTTRVKPRAQNGPV